MTSVALHPACARTATAHYPTVARTGAAPVLTDGRLLGDGDIAVEIAMTERWRLTDTADTH
ncbi:hypothetical protein ACFXO9_31420 [Nocardia tengchongensis]|uniref:hypothetical protein n=1 Tax=Nocardia tengchongensis TaxID=2055889 RepID=UPI0036B17094